MARRSSRVFEIAYLIATNRREPPGVPEAVRRKALKMIYRARRNVPMKAVFKERVAEDEEKAATQDG